MGSSYRGLRHVASFQPYTSKQVGDTGPAESARRSNSRAFGSPFSGAHRTISVATKMVGQKNFPSSFHAVVGFGIRDPGWIKVRIRDKHPGSATLTHCISD